MESQLHTARALHDAEVSPSAMGFFFSRAGVPLHPGMLHLSVSCYVWGREQGRVQEKAAFSMLRLLPCLKPHSTHVQTTAAPFIITAAQMQVVESELERARGELAETHAELEQTAQVRRGQQGEGGQQGGWGVAGWRGNSGGAIGKSKQRGAKGKRLARGSSGVTRRIAHAAAFRHPIFLASMLHTQLLLPANKDERILREGTRLET